MAGSRDGMQIVPLMGLNSRPPAWGSYTWPTPFPLVCPTVFTTSYPDVISLRFFFFFFFTDSQKVEDFLVFVVPGGLFIMQDCHGEAVQLSVLGHIYMFKCVTEVTKVLHFKGKTLSQILHTITSTTLIWKPRADAKSKREWMLSVRRLSTANLWPVWGGVFVSCCVVLRPQNITPVHYTTIFFLMIFLRQSPNWNLSGFTRAGTKMCFLPFNTVP